MAKAKPEISYDPRTAQLTINIDASEIEAEILSAYGLKPAGADGRRAGAGTRTGTVSKSPGRRGRPPKAAKTTKKLAGPKGLAVGEKRRTSAEVQAERDQKATVKKARKALKLAPRGKLKPEDQAKLDKKVAEMSK